jgi:hypothetical protein
MEYPAKELMESVDDKKKSAWKHTLLQQEKKLYQ